jgi:GxxExxY protein
MTLAHGGVLTDRVIGLAIDVHRSLGPGLLESVYEECLCGELSGASIKFVRQRALPIVYRNIRIACAYRMDIVVEDTLLIEVKSVERLLAIHDAQTLTYLRLSGFKIALLMNFGCTVLKDGIRRFVR